MACYLKDDANLLTYSEMLKQQQQRTNKETSQIKQQMKKYKKKTNEK